MLNGLMMTFYSVGAYAGPTYYGWTLGNNPGNWQYGLMTMGAGTVVYGLILMRGLKTKYTDQSKDVKGMHLVQAVRTLGKTRGVWLGVAVAILNIVPYWSFASMGPYLFMTYKGFSAADAGIFFGIVYGIGGLSSVLMGYFADKFGRKPVVMVLSMTNIISAYLIFHVISSSDLVMLYLVASVLGIGLHAIYTLGYTIGQDAVKPYQIGLATGLVGACMYLSSFFSGPLTGYLTKGFGYLVAFDVVVIAFEVALFILAIFMKESRPKVADSKGE